MLYIYFFLTFLGRWDRFPSNFLEYRPKIPPYNININVDKCNFHQGLKISAKYIQLSYPGDRPTLCQLLKTRRALWQF